MAKCHCAAVAQVDLPSPERATVRLQSTCGRTGRLACLRVAGCFGSTEIGFRRFKDGGLRSVEDSQAVVEEADLAAAEEESGSSSCSNTEEDDGLARRMVRLRVLKRAALIREIMVRRQLLLASSMVVGVTVSTALAPWMPSLEAVAAFLEDIPQFSKERELRGLPLATRVVVPEKSQGVIEDEEPEEVLVIEVRVLRSKASQFDVFLNVPDATEATPTSCIEYVGSFFNEPQGVASNPFREVTVRLGISDTMEQLGLSNASSVLVAIVPKGPDKNDTPIFVQNLQIEYE